ncbi:hypothetical protein D3C80_1227830 [compost metagenome]
MDSTRLVSGCGAVVSGAWRVAGSDTAPSVPVALTCSTSPLACALPRLTVKVPSLATGLLPSNSPLGPYTLTVLPASAVPVTDRPSAASTRLSGVAGARTPGAVTLCAGETFCAASAWTTLRLSPVIAAGDRVTLKWPSAPTVAVPSTVLSGARTVTVAPASPLPVSVAPLAETDRLLTAAGGVVSAAV